MAQSDDLLANLARSGRTRIAAALLVTALVGGGLGAVMLRGGSAQLSLLYSGLDINEAAEIAGRLDQANFKYEIRGDGSSIFVGRDHVNDARILLSAEGLPTRGSVGYEIFDQQDALGATTFVQNVNRVRALEGELARTITSLANVKAARVHLVLPERRLFDREAQNPSASIVVDVIGRELDPAQIRAIRNLAAGAVPGLKPETVTLLDSEGRLLATASTAENGSFGGMTADERRASFEQELRNKIMTQLEPIVGPGAARVQISADMDFNRVTQSSEIYDPDSRVVRSTETIEESSSEASRDSSDAATAANNVPQNNGPATTGAADPTEEANSSRLQEIVNYEISRTTKTEVIEGGAIKRLSVAVAIDHRRIPGAVDADGNMSPTTWEPRSEEEMRQIMALVRSAIGYNEPRGDSVEVENIRFATPSFDILEGSEPGAFDFNKNDIMRGVEVGALLIGVLAVVLFVLRPLVGGLLNPKPAQSSDENNLAIPSAPGSPNATHAALGEIADDAGEVGDKVDVANIAGKMKASSMKRIAAMIEEQPDESVSILRTWLNEEVDAA